MPTLKEIEEIRARLEAAKKCDDWGKHGLEFTFTAEKPGRNTALWYGDGDMAAEIHGNMGLGIDGDALGQFFASAIKDVDALLGMIREECCLDPACHFCKTFAEAVESLVKQATDAERLQCCKDICSLCANKVDKFDPEPYLCEGVGWKHACNDKNLGPVQCLAGGILSRVKNAADTTR